MSDLKNTTEKMWDGRFEASMDNSMEKLSFSLHFDSKMLEEDIAGTIAHCKGLVKAGVLTEEELNTVATNLQQIQQDLLKGEKLYDAKDEDIHMAIERILTNRIGDLGKKIHTGRSRNDQVMTDFKLYMRKRAASLISQIETLQQSLLEIAAANQERVMPGYTHVQQAQPILFSHYMLSLFFALERDKGRWSNFLTLHGQMPLGSGALAGSAFPYQRELVAGELNFPEISYNSIDATSHRDMALEFLSNIAIMGSTISRYAEDFVNWSTVEFGFLTLHDAFSSGSSMMPQKKNPDSMELIRGKTGRLVGNLTSLLVTVKGAPLCYSRDLQEDKEPVFDSFEQMETILEVMAGALSTATWNFGRMEAKMDPALLATDLADYLVEEGIPFREAHHIVGEIVGASIKQGCSFLDLGDEFWSKVPNFNWIREKLSFQFSISKRNIQGGTGPDSLKWQLESAQALLKK